MVHISPLQRFTYLGLYSNILTTFGYETFRQSPLPSQDANECLRRWGFELNFLDELADMFDLPDFQAFRFHVFIAIDWMGKLAGDASTEVQDAITSCIRARMPRTHAKGILNVVVAEVALPAGDQYFFTYLRRQRLNDLPSL